MVRMFQEADYPQVSDWLMERGITSIPYHCLSSTGVMIEDVACGFLYFTNSSMGYLDHFITNPKADKIKRRQALELIAQELITLSEKYGVKLLMAGTNYDLIEKIALKNKFKIIGRQTVLARGFHG